MLHYSMLHCSRLAAPQISGTGYRCEPVKPVIGAQL